MSLSVWWNDLSEAEQEGIEAKLALLEDGRPTLSRPQADGSKALATATRRVAQEGRRRYLGVLFGLILCRTALLLLGGDKTDDPA
jgi:hypothetical protein